MRGALAVLIAISLAPIGFARPPVPSQATPVTERKPNKSATNAWPRWLAHTKVGFQDSSVAVDSRGVVHLLQTEAYTQGGGGYRIVTRNSSVETRSATGFSRYDRLTVLDPGSTGTPGHSVGSPDLWAHVDDTLHAVWTHRIPHPDFAKVKQEIYYARKEGINGWSAPVKLTQATEKQDYWQPQVTVDRNGIVHAVARREDSNTGATSFYTAHHFAYNPTIPYAPGSNPKETQISDAKTTGSIRIAVDSNGNPGVAWEEYASGSTKIHFVKGTYGAGTASFPPKGTALGGGVSNGGPDVAFDVQNVAHLVWTGRPSNTTNGQDTVYYRDPVGTVGAVSSVTGAFYAARVAVDSRGQPQVLWGGNGLNYATRIKNPLPDQIDPTWYRQERIAQPDDDENRFSAISEIALDRNDQIHAIDGAADARYTRIVEHGLGTGGPLVNVAPTSSPRDTIAVNAINGNLTFSLPLFPAAGTDPVVGAALTHNSLDLSTGLLAPGWRFSYEVYLVAHSDQEATIFGPDGRPVHFRWNATWSYAVPEDEFGVFDKLEFDDPEWKLTGKTGETLTFNEDGKLREIKLPSGNLLQLDWNASTGRLDAVKDQLPGSGRTTQVKYEATGLSKLYTPRINQVVSPGTTSYNFVYTSAKLTEIRFSSAPNVPTYKFDYHSANSTANQERINLLKKIYRPRGKIGSYGYSISYLQDNRVAKVLDPLSASMTLSYKEDLDPTVQRETRVKNYRTHESLYKIEAKRGLVREYHDPTVLAGGNAGLKPVKNTFDTYGNLTRTEDRWGIATEFDYFTSQGSPQSPHVRNNLKEVRRPDAAGALQWTARYTYTSDTFNLVESLTTACKPSQTSTQRSRVTRYFYDSSTHLLEHVALPDVTEPVSVSQTGVTIRYERNGPRHALTRVVNEESRSTWFMNHDAGGMPQTIKRDGDAESVQRSYNALGLPTGETAPTGGPRNDPPAQKVTQYDGMWRVRQTNDGRGLATTFGWDEDSNPTSVKIASQAAHGTSYDRRGFADGGNGPDGGWSQSADALGNVTSHANIRGGATTTTFDSLNRPTRIIAPDATTDVTYDDFGGGVPTIITRVGGARQKKIKHDKRGRPNVVEETGRTVKTHYDEQDGVLAEEVLQGSAVQACTVYARDDRDRTFRVRLQNGAFGSTASGVIDRTLARNKAGFVLRESDPLGDVANVSASAPHVTKYKPDDRQRVEEITDGFGVVVRRFLYGDDDLVHEALWPDPATKGTSLVTMAKYGYTGGKELKSALNRNDQGITNTYSSFPGNVDTTIDASNRTTRRTYYGGSTERLQSTTQAYGTPDARTVSMIWDRGLVKNLTVWNPESQTHSSTFTMQADAAFRHTETQYPTVTLGVPMGKETTTYWATGEPNVVTIGVGAAKQTRTHQWNDLSQNTRIDFTGGFPAVSQSRGVNVLGQVESVTEPGVSHTMTYDRWRGAPQDETFSVGWSQIQRYGIDHAGNQVSFTDAQNKIHGSPVDANNRPLRIQYDGGDVSVPAYTPGGLIDRRTIRSSAGATIAEEEIVYDGLGRRSQAKTVQASTGKVISDLRWTYTAVDTVDTYAMAHLGVIWTYLYNHRDEVRSESTPGNSAGAAPPYTNVLGAAPTGLVSANSATVNARPSSVLAVPAWSATYVLDPAGNRTSQTVNGVTTNFQLNAGSQLIKQTQSGGGRTVDHQYDEFGNETYRRTVQGATTTEEAFGYNHLNLWSSYTKKVNGTFTVKQSRVYSPSGQLLEDWDQMPATPVARVTLRASGEVKTESTRSSGSTALAPANTFVGLGLDSKTTQIAAGTTPVRTHLVGDLVGSVTMTLTDAGAVQAQAVKSAFGLPVASQASMDRANKGIAGSWLAANTEFSFLQNRFYDPSIGRFTQTDPLLGNRPTQHYAYAGNNPLSFIDPFGLDLSPAWGQYGTREAVKRGDWKNIAIDNKFTEQKFRDLQTLYNMEDDAGFLSWAFGQTSKIKGGIEDRERDLNRIIKEGAYPVLQDEVAKRKTLAVTFGRGVVDMATAATGAGKGGTTEIATAEAPIVSGVGQTAVATGGKSGLKWKWSGAIPESQAAEAYAVIRASETDVAAIARNQRLGERSIERLKKIKDYLFNNPAWTNADSDIAAAWHRLRTGGGTAEDMMLLKHEVAEMWLRQNKNMPYAQAHREANELFNWQKMVEGRQGQ